VSQNLILIIKNNIYDLKFDYHHGYDLLLLIWKASSQKLTD